MNRARIALAALVCLSLACQALTDFITLEGPEDRATDAFWTALPTLTPPAPATQPAATSAAATPTTATPAPDSTAAPAPDPTPATAGPLGDWPLPLALADEAQAAMRPGFESHLALLPDASRYVIDVVVTFDGARSAALEGRMRIAYTNQHDAPLDDLVLMLWPNFERQYLGGVALGAVSVDGQPVTPVLEHNGIAARLPLAQPLAPGARAEVLAEFSGQALAGLEGGARYGLTNGVLIAPSFYPLIPRIVDGAWQAEPPAPGGDTTNSDTSFYALRVTAPAGLRVAASGSRVAEESDGATQTVLYVTGPMRDMALVVGALETHTEFVDDIAIHAHMLPRHATYAAELLAEAAQQVRLLQALVGPYPFAELDIVDSPGAFGGIEYPGLNLIGVVGDAFAERANVHEVGHQWFYSLIGSDQLLEPWLDESLASYTEVLFDEHTYNPETAERSLDGFRQYVASASDPTLPIGLPMGDYPSPNDYILIVYGKGPLFLDALRREMGDSAFFSALQSYYDDHLYGFAHGPDFQAAAERACGCDLQAMFDLWVYEGGAVE